MLTRLSAAPDLFIAKAELFKFPVSRGEKDERAARHAAKVLAQGLPLGMFPEGKRSKSMGLAFAKTGIVRLSIEAHDPILPVG